MMGRRNVSAYQAKFAYLHSDAHSDALISGWKSGAVVNEKKRMISSFLMR